MCASLLKRANLFSFGGHVDWILFCAAALISLAGLLTMRSFTAENFYFTHQIVWIVIAWMVFFVASIFEYRFLQRTTVVVLLYAAVLALLALIFVLGHTVMGATTRFNLGLFAVQPADPAKLILVLILAKYFARRHIEIAQFRHVIISGAYAFALFLCVFLQPDLGSGIVIVSIWLGMSLVSGLSRKHLIILGIAVALVSSMAWVTLLKPYQKARVVTFLHPAADIRGAGYSAYQSTVAVGNGEVVGKGVGFGTQSKLSFLPEFQTDFIFAAFAEEWGFVGAVLLFCLYAILIWRILALAARGTNNFDTLVTVGVAIYFIAQFTVHVGMDMGLLPITGTTLPLMSYGGSHLVTEYFALGLIVGMSRHAHASVQARDETELIGAV